MKYDSYYEREMVYKMTLEELNQDYMTNEKILAYIRHRGDKIRFYLNFENELRRYSGVCTIKNVEDSSYNPLIEKNFREGNWYHPYKITIKCVDDEEKYDSYYFMDFCSLINQGYIELWGTRGINMETLFSKIINIQTGNIREIMKKFNVDPSDPAVWRMIELAYKIGHRDARHAAADLVAENTNS